MSQDWTVVSFKRHSSKKKQMALLHARSYTLKLEPEIQNKPMSRIQADSLQDLIRTRIKLSLNQENADQVCSFPLGTFKDIECNRYVPNEKEIDRIQLCIDVQLKIEMRY
jgi:hypothetical protein